MLLNFNISMYFIFYLKSNCAANHPAKARSSRPSAINLAFDKYVSVWSANSDTTGATISLVIGAE